MYGENYTASVHEVNQTEGSKAIEGKIKLAMFGKAKCRLGRGPTCIEAFEGQACGDLPQEVASKMKMSGVMKAILC